MASGITYKIGGKYDAKGEKDAIAGISNIKTAVSSFNNILKGVIGVKVFSEIKKVVDVSTDTFLQQNKALKNLEIAARNANVPFEKLAQTQTKLSHNNFIDDDTINNALALGLNMGLTAEQLDKVATAAEDMYSAGIMPMDQAIKNLTQSYSGNLGQLKKIAPELGNLTKQQLKSGEAVDILAEKYRGYAETMTQTFSGRQNQFDNSYVDLKAAVGSIVQGVKFVAEGKWLEPLNKLTGWIVDNRENIIKTILMLPELAKISISSIWDMVKLTFTGEGITNILTFITQSILVTFKTAFSGVFSLMKLLVQDIKVLWDNLINGNIWNLWENFVENAIDNMKKKHPKFFAFMFGDSEGPVFTNSKNASLADITTGLTANLDSFLSGIGMTLKYNLNDLKAVGSNFLDFYKDDSQAMIASLIEAWKNAGVPEDLLIAFEKITVPDTTGGSNGNSDGNSEKNSLKNIYNSLGEIGTLINSFMNNGPLGVILSALATLISAISSSSEKINSVLNFMTTLISRFVYAGSSLVTILESIIGPLVPVITLIGDILNKIFKLFEPVFTFLISGVVRSILSTVVIILTGIYNAIVLIHNLFASKKNDWAYMSVSDNVDSLWSDYGTSSSDSLLSSTSTAASGSASYTAARDTYVTVNFNGPTLGTGDSESMAVYLAREIKRAEAMNLV